MEVTTTDRFSHVNDNETISNSDVLSPDTNETGITARAFVLSDCYDLPVYGLDNGLFYALHVPVIVSI